jgi:hypothetical protein
MASVSSYLFLACLLLALCQASEYSETISRLSHQNGESVFPATSSRFFAFLFPIHEKSSQNDVMKTSEVIVDLNKVQRVSGAGSEVYLVDNFRPHLYEKYISQISMDNKNGIRAFSGEDSQKLLKSFKVLQQCISDEDFKTEQKRGGKVTDVKTGDEIDMDLIKGNLHDFCTLRALSSLIKNDQTVNLIAFQFAPIPEKLPEKVVAHIKELYQSEIQEVEFIRG